MNTYLPKWHRELSLFASVKPLLILEGNVLDSYRYPLEGSISQGAIVRLPEYLHYYLTDYGYQNILFYDHLQGFRNPIDAKHEQAVERLTGQNRLDLPFRNGAGISAPEGIRRMTAQTKEATAIVMTFASRCIVSPGQMTQQEADSFTLIQKASMEALEIRTANKTLKNLIILIVSKVNDLPAWFYLDNPNCKIITLEPPSREEREALVEGDFLRHFFDSKIYQEEIGHYEEQPEELMRIRKQFAARTVGMRFTELNALRRLSKQEHFSIASLCDVIDLYRYGIRENPWKKLNCSMLETAEAQIRHRVKGQDAAVQRSLDVIKRAVTGLSGLHGSSSTRPKGVLFFAGPTGTGRTETAKTLAELLFGDENCCIRFDMSEYSQSHSDQKLLGAPPGYVGYEAGGQLTNAVRRNPFSILLFDEIEKAHPSVLDKFLQILEDGRMTDGQGNTAYFSECIIIFTSNLGIYVPDGMGGRKPNVTIQDDYPTVYHRVRTAVEEHFKLELGRPELLNRIGENIVVFDFIRPETAMEIILAQMDRICKFLSTEKHISLTLSDEAFMQLTAEAEQNLENGGRGIGNVVEKLIINPLSRYMFDHEIPDGTILQIESVTDFWCTKKEEL